MAYRDFLVALVGVSRRSAIWVLAGTALLTGILLTYTVTHLSLDTDPLNLLDRNLIFRQLTRDFEHAFPQFTDLVAVVIDAGHLDEADEAADRLAAELSLEHGLFHSVYQPGQGPFFDRQGLLYLDTAELLKLDRRLTEWEPFLGTLAQDPSLRGFFSVLGKAVEHPPEPDNQKLLIRVLDWVSGTIEAQLTGRPSSRFWREAFQESIRPSDEPYRRFVLVQPRQDYSSLQAAESPLRVLRSLAKQVAKQYGVRIRLTGSGVIEEEERETLAHSAGFAATAALILIGVIVWLGFRSGSLVGAILLTLLVGLVWTAAFATFAIGSLNMISATVPIVFIGLGVDFGIQFAVRYRESRELGANHASALAQAAQGAGGALTLAALASAISFFSFFPTHYRGLAELGLIAGASMLIAFFANLTVLPALLTLLSPRLSLAYRPAGPAWLADFSLTHHRRKVLLITLAFACASVALLPQARFDFNPLHLRDPATEGVSTFMELLADPKTTPYTIQILTENQTAAGRLAARLKTLAEVDKSVTLTSYVPADQEEKLAILDELALVLQPVVMPAEPIAPPSPEERVEALRLFYNRVTQVQAAGVNPELAASLARLASRLARLQAAPGGTDSALSGLEKQIVADLPKGLERLRRLLTPTMVTLQDLPPDLVERYLAPDGRVRLEVYPAEDVGDNETLRRFVRAVQAVAPNATGTAVAMVAGGDVIVQACLQAAGLALVAATLLILAALRSLRDTLLVLVPLALTIPLTIATTVVANIPLNLANITALPLLLGLGIAFGIYLVLRKREGITVDQLFSSSTAQGVLLSALTNLVSFGSLAFATHRGMASMGLLVSVTLAFALLGSLIVLPLLMPTRSSGNLGPTRQAIASLVGRAEAEGAGYNVCLGADSDGSRSPSDPVRISSSPSDPARISSGSISAGNGGEPS